MLIPILLLAFLSVSLGLSRRLHHPMANPEWRAYKLKFRKVYISRHQDRIRYNYFMRNLKEIKDHNLIHTGSYRKGVNDFTDMHHYEFRRYYTNGYKVSSTKNNRMYLPTTDTVPNYVNWVNQGLVTRVKNQGRCRSCYAFSSTGALEGQWKKKTGELRELSEQNLIDCTTHKGNRGCFGGSMVNNFKYIKENVGINSESYYPYVAVENKHCFYNEKFAVAHDNGSTKIPYADEEALKRAVATVGPISVAIDASQKSFQQYESGIYYESGCNNSVSSLNFAVLVVGYGTDEGLDYWLVKNSWGPNWGDNGYIRMARNLNNQCGIASRASYPIVG